jgi:GNAT superfamily N-acetyltransferase
MKAAVPEFLVSEKQLRDRYENRDPSIRFQRWVVLSESDIVAYGFYDQSAKSREFDVYGVVHPDYQSQGIGRALYEHIITNLLQFNPSRVRTYALENKSQSVEFLKARGFQETQQDQQEYLMFCNVTSFDASASSEIEEVLQSKGITIRTLKELRSNANYINMLRELFNELILQTPGSQLLGQKTYDEFVSELTRPDLLPEAYNIALHQGEYIGMNALHKSPVPEGLFNEFTGVKQEYRKMGIAKALKLRGMAYAKAHGYSTITTRNNIRNGRIIQLNKQLGFVAITYFVKAFQ